MVISMGKSNPLRILNARQRNRMRMRSNENAYKYILGYILPGKLKGGGEEGLNIVQVGENGACQWINAIDR